ncbi:hypothetical protein AcW1_000976 [Taiwanofungus camphoratus]|nr:hypothetical protein AcW1_000976 [Antrodia cinnamomea]
MSSSTIFPPSQSKSWWARSKSSKDPAGLRPHGSFVDDEKPMSSIPHGHTKHKDSTTGIRFKTLGSAIGFKSRKPPSLAIQDPPIPPARTPVSTAHQITSARETDQPPSPFYNSRPPAKSVSTVRSSEGDEASDLHTLSEPRTPSDHPRDRMSYQTSVLTLSEVDPFAAGGVIIQQTTHDSNRISAYSDSSLLDPHSKVNDMVFNNRISYGSSSSNSHGHSSEGQPGRLASRQMPSSRLLSDSTIRLAADSHRDQVHLKTPNGSNSSCSTVTSADGRNRLSEPSPGYIFAPHERSRAPAVRARGMTAVSAGGGDNHRPNTASGSQGISALTDRRSVAPLQLRRKASDSSYGLHSLSSSTAPSPSPVTFTRSRSSTVNSGDSSVSPFSTRPLVVVRKASSNRVNVPPLDRSPPSADLPPPPLSPLSSAADSLEDLSVFPDPPSSSSSSLSFAPSIDLSEVYSPHGDAIKQLMRQTFGRSSGEGEHKRRGKSRSGHRDVAPKSPAATVRNFDVDVTSLPSTSKSPPLSAVHGEELFSDSESSHLYSPRVLKKAASQQSLLKRYSGASVTSSIASGSVGHDDVGHGKGASASSSSGKAPRKQRSFHHSRLPLPPLPTLRHVSSSPSGTGSEVPLPSPTVSTTEHPRRGSVTSPAPPATRKRLFSGSSIRRSTSSHAASSADDDVRSVHSTDEPRTGAQKIVMSFGSYGSPLSLLTNNSCVAPSSFWNDSGTISTSPSHLQSSKRASQSDYVPQHIMSPADMLKLEQQLADAEAVGEVERDRKPKLELQPGDLGEVFIGRKQISDSKGLRSRADSMISSVSSGSVALGTHSQDRNSLGEMFNGTGGLSPSLQSPSSFARQSSLVASPSKLRNSVTDGSRLPLRSSSVMAKSPKPPSLSVRPSTAQPSIPSPTSPTFSSFSRSPDNPSVSLPPPPRSRPSRDQQSPQQEPTTRRSSLVPLHPLSPPPVRPKNRRQNNAPDSRDHAFHHSSTPPSAFDQKVVHRKSIMKKPSFLDIEDELDITTENLLDVELDAPPSSPVMENSFLDLDRGKDSFDTVRSCDSDFYV